MSCERPVFFPGGPCCGGANSFCSRWPNIDFSRLRWIVRMPSAESGHERSVQYAFDGGRLEYPRLAIPGNRFSYVGAVALTNSIDPPTPDIVVFQEVYGGTFANWIRGGRFVAAHNGACQWFVRCRERLCPGVFALAIMFKADHDPQGWFPAANVILEVAGDPPTEFDLANFSGGSLMRYPSGSANPQFYVSWRDVLKAAECNWLPKVRAMGWDYLSESTSAIDLGLKRRLELANDAIRNPFSGGTHYEPTAIDLASDGLITEGISFGIVSDPRSPLFGQFTIFDGGTRLHDFDGEPAEDGLAWFQWYFSGVLQSVPWVLTSGSDVVAEIGFVNRFERNDDNSTLPAWVELELQPV
jgi:hypothetical protein